MQAKLDTNKSYGTVYGHINASYEQNGVLFDAAGNSLSGDKLKSTIPDNDEGKLTDEKTFLLNILVGGAVLQSNIKTQSEEVGLIWSEILTTAADMKITKTKVKGGGTLWRLPAE